MLTPFAKENYLTSTLHVKAQLSVMKEHLQKLRHFASYLNK